MFTMVDDSTIFTHLSCLNVKKATSPDQFSSRFLKEVANEIVVLLTNLFLQQKVVQLAWKESNITPICDWLWENPPVTHKDKYLEIRNSIIQSVISREGLKLHAYNSLQIYSYLIAIRLPTAQSTAS